ncbi:hypothetical protein ACSBR2_035244 [Camellia fascicularis]
MPYVHPTSGERYYLGMLLNKVCDVENFKHIRTINRIEHTIFKSTYIAFGLLDDDNE